MSMRIKVDIAKFQGTAPRHCRRVESSNEAGQHSPAHRSFTAALGSLFRYRPRRTSSMDRMRYMARTNQARCAIRFIRCFRKTTAFVM